MNDEPFQVTSGRSCRFGNAFSPSPLKYGVRSWKAPCDTVFMNAAPLYSPFWLKLM